MVGDRGHSTVTELMMIFDFLSPFRNLGVQRNLHLIVLLEREEDAYWTGLLDQYPALYRNAELRWCPVPSDHPQMVESIQGICKLIDCSGSNIPPYAVEVLSSVEPWSRSPLRLLQFIKTFTGLHSKTAHSISSRCDVLKVSVVQTTTIITDNVFQFINPIN